VRPAPVAAAALCAALACYVEGAAGRRPDDRPDVRAECDAAECAGPDDADDADDADRSLAPPLVVGLLLLGLAHAEEPPARRRP